MDEIRYEPENRAPVIERNGAEYLITLNGSVFLALSFAAAQRIAYRMAGCRSAGSLAGPIPADVAAPARHA